MKQPCTKPMYASRNIINNIPNPSQYVYVRYGKTILKLCYKINFIVIHYTVKEIYPTDIPFVNKIFHGFVKETYDRY